MLNKLVADVSFKFLRVLFNLFCQLVDIFGTRYSHIGRIYWQKITRNEPHRLTQLGFPESGEIKIFNPAHISSDEILPRVKTAEGIQARQ